MVEETPFTAEDVLQDAEEAAADAGLDMHAFEERAEEDPLPGTGAKHWKKKGKKRKYPKRTPEQKAAQAERLKKYWSKRRGEEAQEGAKEEPEAVPSPAEQVSGGSRKKRVRLSSIRALDGAVKIAGAAPLVVFHKVARIATKGRFSPMGDPQTGQPSLIPPEAINDCQEKFADAAGVLELNINPWAAWGLALAGACLGSFAIWATMALDRVEARSVASTQKPAHHEANGIATSGTGTVDPNDLGSGPQAAAA